MPPSTAKYPYDDLLRTSVAGIEMRTPVLTASGTFGFGEEFADFVDLARLGGVMVKGTTLAPRRGNEGVRIAETPQGMLNCIGLENPGVEHFLTEILPRIRPYGMNVIVNISGSSVEDYAEIARRLNVDGVAVCGPPIMMERVAGIASEYGIPCEVSLEKRMACGLGACLSCAVDTKSGRRKVCKDGPVFPAGEVYYAS